MAWTHATHHVSRVTESHSHPSCSCALHIDIQESIISSVGVYTNEQITTSTRATGGTEYLQAVIFRSSHRSHGRNSASRGSGDSVTDSTGSSSGWLSRIYSMTLKGIEWCRRGDTTSVEYIEVSWQVQVLPRSIQSNPLGYTKWEQTN